MVSVVCYVWMFKYVGEYWIVVSVLCSMCGCWDIVMYVPDMWSVLCIRTGSNIVIVYSVVVFTCGWLGLIW